MSKKHNRAAQQSARPPQNTDLDILLEEYMSKLEQKVVSQTQQFKTITDNAASCLFMIDAFGQPTFMNPAAQKITGYTFEEIKDSVIHDVMHHIHPDGTPFPIEQCPIITAIKNMQQIKDQEDVFIRKDGSFFPISFSVAPLHQDGTVEGAVLEFQDITKRKELERQKDEFISIASHELKTPVTSIKGYTQALQKRFDREGNTRAVELLKKMDNQLNKLTSLISDLLDVTKMEQGKLQFHKDYFDFNELVLEVVEEMQRVTEQHKITTKLAQSKSVYGDRDRIGQVITNFISNAIKYSPQADKIIVATKIKESTLTLIVEDFGIGIPKDKQAKIFDRFYRAGGDLRETYAGLGLGLYISAEFIKRHEGEIGVQSAEGNGSLFYFTLPTNQ